MNLDIITILAGGVTFVAGLLGGLYLIRPPRPLSVDEYQQKAQEQLNHTNTEIKKIHDESAVKIENIKIRSKNDEDRMKEQFKRIENLIHSKEEQLNAKTSKNSEIKTIIDYENGLITSLNEKNAQLRKDFIVRLSQKNGKTPEEMKEALMQELRRDLELERAEKLKKHEEALLEDREAIAKNIIVNALQRYSNPTSVEKRATIITVPRDEFKARVIGQNCQTLQLLEQLLEVDIIFNDAPNTIIISYYDLVRSHIAAETINKLLREKNVTLELVKAKIKEAEIETEKTFIAIGKETVKRLNLMNRKFPDEFFRAVGRLQFRTSYGQNILKHSFEVGTFTMMLGSELGLNMETCKIGGFFHDLGKAIDHEVNSPHDVLTKELMEKFGFSAEEVHAAWTHHDSIPIQTAEALIVKAADALSAGRPGARAESLDKYLERIRALENIATSYEGVSKAFAISAGREVRVMVDPAELVDDDLNDLARSIADDIQENVGFPGKIKINVIRRTQSTDYAKK